MAAIRAFLIFLVIVGSFLIGTPLQALIVRRAPRWADAIPHLFCRSILRLAKVRVAAHGTRASGPVLIVANHMSWIDILAFRAVAPICFLAKADVARWPIVSAFAAVQGTILVERGRPRSILPANETMAARMAEGRPVLLFPEGTTTRGPEPGPFRSSHLAAARDFLAVALPGTALAVQPAAIHYSSETAAWVGDDALLPHLWRVLRGPPLSCTIAFGVPLTYDAGTDRKALARAAQAAVVGLVAARGAPVTADGATSPGRCAGARAATGGA